MMHKMAGSVFDVKRMGTPEAFAGRDVGPWCVTTDAKCGREVLVEVELDGHVVRPKINGHDSCVRWADTDCPECLALQWKTAT